ncbi:ChbG/HpnK family deacetylase [Algoriphagus sp.]|uniref:ChbG/HpnK family deacetylase n=1 Tax=Algoriphagus sp. TaxID=1872435 RepID=UPI0025E9154B|nr:ChbG/HpnK family deacetylase [Algoriphagus sp.]
MESFKGLVTKLIHTRIDYPSVNAEKGILIPQNSEVEISHAVKGQMYRTSDNWYVLTNKTFIWSGAIHTGQDIPVISKKLLITADDIGIVKEIDLGAKIALREGWINSVAILVNGENDADLRDFSNFLKTATGKDSNIPLFETTHVGLHFTITSGKPVANAADTALLLDQDGCFSKFTEIDKIYETDQCISQIKIEFQAQYDKFKRIFGREPDHLTSHHDVLTFNFPLFKFMHEWSSEKNIPIRTHKFLPSGKRFWYDTLVIRKLDLPSISRMDEWKNENGTKAFGPEHTFVAHYGPIPPFAVVDYPSEVRKKNKKIKEAISDFLLSRDSVREIVIHLIKSDFRAQRDLIIQHKSLLNLYSGIDIKYFDGRVAEYLSLKNNNFIKTNPWVQFLPCSYRLTT